MLFYRKHYPAESVVRIRMANLFQAYWRITTLNLMMPFLKDRAGAEVKLIKYRVACRAMRRGNEE